MSLIDKLTKEQIADFREAFSLFDHDENGSISATELGQVLSALGQTPSANELSDMINEVDVDGNGTVEFAEFVILMTNKVKEMTKEEEITEAFSVLDKEKDSHISAKETKTCFHLFLPFPTYYIPVPKLQNIQKYKSQNKCKAAKPKDKQFSKGNKENRVFTLMTVTYCISKGDQKVSNL